MAGFITLTQAALIAGVSPRTLRQAAASGTLVAERITDRLYLTTDAAVRDWMATKRRGRRRKKAA